MKNALILLAVAFSLGTAQAELTASHQAAIEKLLEVLQVQKQQITLAADIMKISQERMKTLTPQILEIMKTEMAK